MWDRFVNVDGDCSSYEIIKWKRDFLFLDILTAHISSIWTVNDDHVLLSYIILITKPRDLVSYQGHIKFPQGNHRVWWRAARWNCVNGTMNTDGVHVPYYSPCLKGLTWVLITFSLEFFSFRRSSTWRHNYFNRLFDALWRGYSETVLHLRSYSIRLYILSILFQCSTKRHKGDRWLIETEICNA